MSSTSFDKFAVFYDKVMGESGDYTHKVTIDPALFKAAGNLKSKVVYDIGCGNGSISRKESRRGAKEVWASDISPELIKIAKTKYPIYKINYLVRDGNNFKEIPRGYFDLITMNMSVHYIKNIITLFKNIRKILKKGGRVAITTDHPLKYSTHLDEKRIKTLAEFLKRSRSYLDDNEKYVYNNWTKKRDLLIYKRPLSKYIEALAGNGLFIDIIVEPKTKQLSSYFGGKKIKSEIPAYLGIGAKKI